MTAALSVLLPPDTGVVVAKLQQQGVILWCSGASLNYRIPPAKKVLRYQIQGLSSAIYNYLKEQVEERAGIIMASGADYPTATQLAESQCLRQAIMDASPEMAAAVLTAEDSGCPLESLTLPNGETLWNATRSS